MRGCRLATEQAGLPVQTTHVAHAVPIEQGRLLFREHTCVEQGGALFKAHFLLLEASGALNREGPLFPTKTSSR